jgi:tetratricopeptide (TPR) repeat protein
MAEDLDLPDEIYGFGSWLLWLIATRATDLVDQMYEAGPARRSGTYGTVEGHHVPTPSLIAWMLTAAETGLPPQSLTGRDRGLGERQKILRTQVSRALAEDARLFRDGWLRALALQCGFSDAELYLLESSRDERHYPIVPERLRDAISRTFRSRPALAGRAGRHVAVSRLLPRPTSSFTGRDEEIAQLTAAVGAGQAAVQVIGGMAGVGKSALAEQAGWLLASQFPDGQFYVPLHGHSPGLRPADPADALAGLLLADGVAAAQIPASLTARADKWRERVAGRRLLVILDDAVSSEQVRPLLPGTPGCLVLVTSRRRLTSLPDARTISLDVLPPEQTALLISRLAARPGVEPGDDAMGELARACGNLPLAAGMIARKLHHHPAWSVADVTADLATAQDRLELMTAEDTSVAAAFELSYADLTDDQQYMFRRLTGHPGTEIDAWTAAALAGTDAHAARRGLEALYDHYLLAEPSKGRYVFHDLVRAYAGALASADPLPDREAAARRLVGYYRQAAGAANRLIDPRGRVEQVQPEPEARSPITPAFASRAEAFSWLDAERLSLGAAVGVAVQLGMPDHAVAIPGAMHAYLRSAGHRDLGLALHSAAVASARSSADLRAEASASRNLGEMQQATGDLTVATASHTAALRLSGQLADNLGQAKALVQLGLLDYLTSDYSSSAAKLTRALELFRSEGDGLGEADALTHLGYLHYIRDESDAATECLTRAFDICRELDDRPGQYLALIYLAFVQNLTGQYLASSAGLVRALELAEAEGDNKAQGDVLTTLGNSQILTGHYTDALASLTRSLEFNRRSGNTLGEANALSYLGLLQRRTGKPEEAIASQERSRDLYRRRGSRLGEANTLLELGAALTDTGRFDDAAQSLQAALAEYGDIDEPLGEAEALSYLGDLMVASGHAGLAREHYERALALAERAIAPAERAHALTGLGTCLLHSGQVPDGLAALQEAAAICREVQSPDALRIEEILRQHGHRVDAPSAT